MSGRGGVASQSFERACDHLVTFLALATKGKRASVPISRFDGCDAFVSGADKDRLTENVQMFGDVRPHDVGEPINYGFVGNVVGVDGAFHLNRIKTLSVKQRRGLPADADFEFITAAVWPDGRYESNRLFVKRGRERWTVVWPRREPFMDDANTQTDLIVGAQFSSRYYWRVLLGYQGHPRIAFMTDPVGAAAAFRLRDIPEGRERRAALRHWVTEHWRKNRTDPSEEHRVRAHLRGATEFSWNGLRCSIVPAAFDRERAEKGEL